MGNYDAHAKNVSVVYVTADRMRLAPAYDVVVTAVYDGLDRDFALYFGGTTHPQALTRTSLEIAAREFTLPIGRVTEISNDVAHLIQASLPAVLEDVRREGGHGAMLEKLETSVMHTSAEFTKCLGL